MVIPPYASILNRKLVVPSTRAAYFAVDEHFLVELMMPRVEKIRVDEKWYLAVHPDVGAAIESGAVAGAKAHYCRYGYYEHRMPYPVKVDENWYINEYPDVRAAVAAKSFQSGQEHFEMLGYREGRFPYPEFRLDTSE